MRCVEGLRVRIRDGQGEGWGVVTRTYTQDNVFWFDCRMDTGRVVKRLKPLCIYEAEVPVVPKKRRR